MTSTTLKQPNHLAMGPVLFFGFAMALAIWCAWFITHLPWLGLPESTSIPIILLTWLAAAGWAGLGRAPRVALATGTLAGLLSATLGLAILGSKIAEPSPGFEAVNPGALLIALGFLTLGSFIGGAGALVASLLPFRRPEGSELYLWRFGILTVAAMAPLLVIGGMVTSTNAGMAVPDWPNTFGSNMFLYPLGPRASPDVYFEHSHRLFGTFVGLTVLVLMVWILSADTRRWVRIMAVLAFTLVCIQGLIGGARVLRGSVDLAHDPTLDRLVHGVLAQLVFALIVAIAAVLTPTFRRLSLRCICGHSLLGISGDETVLCPQCRRQCPRPISISIVAADGRLLRFAATGMLHSTLLQLLLGAAYRHGRHMYMLWAHAAFSIIVVVFAAAAGFAAANLVDRYGGIGPILRRTGQWIVAIIALQFTLGWASFALGGHALRPETVVQALIRTTHQANGALFLALATLAYVWVLRLLWVARRTQPANASIAPLPVVSAHA
jgi:hypothetical protein